MGVDGCYCWVGTFQKHPMEVVVYSDSKYVDAVEKMSLVGKKTIGKKMKIYGNVLRVYRKHKVHFQWIKGHNQHP